ncbi:unnamed protein product [Rhizophagus irregularis]|nr:unnamed protein product [Rhizophagus irregularis]
MPTVDDFELVHQLGPAIYDTIVKNKVRVGQIITSYGLSEVAKQIILNIKLEILFMQPPSIIKLQEVGKESAVMATTRIYDCVGSPNKKKKSD